ncbi:MAG: hypothetical protein RJA99_4278 [Pseudomonadota bacterium]|jgi:hypothetical protein
MSARRSRLWRPGQRVTVTSGPARGRVGVVQMHGLDGVAVRLVALDPLWPFTELQVFHPAELRAIRVARSMPAGEPALL